MVSPPDMIARWKEKLAEYGKVAVVVYLVIFALVYAGFVAAIAAGVHVESASGRAGVLGAAWVATKLTQIFRIGATLLVTPLVARLWWRLTGRPAAVAPSEPAQKT